jgi:uncharacterized membrane protein
MLWHGKKMRIIAMVFISLAILIAPIYHFLGDAGVELPHSDGILATRANFDVGVDSIVEPDPDHAHAKPTAPPLKLDVTAKIRSYDPSGTNQLWANITVKRLATGTFEGVAGNNTYTLNPSEVKEIYFDWYPSTDSNYYLLNISVTCLSGIDSDLTNNVLEVEILINSGRNSKPKIISHSDGSNYAKTPQKVVATVWNYGTLKIANNFWAKLDVKDGMTSVYTDLKLIDVYTAGSDIQEIGNSTSVAFNDWIPAQTGQYSLNVETRLIGDTFSGDNVSSVSVTITNVTVAGVEVVALEPTIQVIPPGQNTLAPPYTAYRFKIQNRGSKADKFNWTATSGNDWILGLNPTTGETPLLTPNDWSDEIEIDIAVPISASQAQVDDLVLEAVSWNDPGVSASNLTRTYTQEEHDMEVIAPNPKWGTPGDDFISYVFMIKNTGNVAEKFEVFLGGNQSGWPARLHTFETDLLQPDETDWILTEIQVPPLNYDTRIQDHTFYGGAGFLTLSARSKYTGSTESATVYTYVNLVYTADIKIVPKNMYIDPHPNETQSLTFNLHVRNVCNREEAVTEGESDINLSVSADTPKFYLAWNGVNETEGRRWDADISKKATHLKMGAWDNDSILYVKAPRAPFNGKCEINVTASSTGDGAGFGIEVNSTASAYAFVNQTAGVDVTPPEDAYYVVYDNNSNGISDWKEGAPLDTVLLKFNVSNLGNGLDRYLLEAWADPHNASTEPEDWIIDFPKSNISSYLIPKEFNKSDPDHYDLVQINITIPGNLDVGYTCDIYLKAISEFNNSVSDWAVFTISVKQGFAVILDPELNQSFIMPNETVVYNINVTNAGNGPDTIEVTLDFEALPNWVVHPQNWILDLERGEMKRINVSVTPDREADASQSLEIIATGRSTNDPEKYDDIKMITTVKQIAEVDLRPLPPTMQHGVPGKTLKFKFEIENTGNAADTFAIFAQNLYNWTMKFENPGRIGQYKAMQPLLLEKDEVKVFNITIRIPPLSQEPTLDELLGNGTMAFTVNDLIVNATSNFDPTMTNQTNATILVDQLARARLSTARNSYYIMPGEKVVYNVTIRNTGNYRDVFNLSVGYADEPSQFKYASWWSISKSVIELNVTLKTTFEFTVEPGIASQPILHEEALLIIYAQSHTGPDTLDALSTHTKIIMISTSQTEYDIDFGQSMEFTVNVMNVPTHDDYRGNYYVYCFDSRGEIPSWDISYDPVVKFTNNPYDIKDITFVVNAPNDLGENDASTLRLEISVVRSNETGPVPDLIEVKLRLVYFDVFIEDIHVYEKGTNNTLNPDELIEGDEIDIQVVVVCVGKRSQNNIKINLYINDELVEPLEIPQSDPSILPGRKETFFLNHTYELERLPWDTKQEEYKIEVLVDEEREIWESEDMGMLGAEDNNLYMTTWKVNDSPVHIAVSLTFIFILLALVLVLVFIVYYKERKPFLVVLLAVFVGILGFLFFAIPWGTMNLDTNTVNYIGKAIIIVTFLFLLMVTYLSLRSTYPYLRYRLKEIEERSKRAMDRRRRRLGIAGGIEEEAKTDEKEKDEESEEEEEMFSNKAVPYSIILITSVAGLLVLLLGSGIVLAFSTGEVVDLFHPFIGTFAFIPTLVWVAFYFVLGIVLIFLIQRGQIKALDDILDADNIIERFKKDAERKMYSEEYKEYYDDYERAFYGTEEYGEGGEDY